jgi:hypothetical protein
MVYDSLLDPDSEALNEVRESKIQQLRKAAPKAMVAKYFVQTYTNQETVKLLDARGLHRNCMKAPINHYGLMNRSKSQLPRNYL